MKKLGTLYLKPGRACAFAYPFAIAAMNSVQMLTFAMPLATASRILSSGVPEPPVQHQRHADHAADALQALDVDDGRARVEAVRRADGDRQRVDAGVENEARGFVRVGLQALLLADRTVSLRAGKNPQLGLDRYAQRLCHLHHPAGHFDIFRVRMARRVHHDGCVAGFDRGFDGFDGFRVVQVQRHRDVDVGGGHFGQLSHLVVAARVVGLKITVLQNDRHAEFLRRAGHRLGRIQRPELERADGVALCRGFLQHFSHGNKVFHRDCLLKYRP